MDEFESGQMHDDMQVKEINLKCWEFFLGSHVLHFDQEINSKHASWSNIFNIF